MSNRDVPVDWWDLLGKADLVDPRDGAPSMTALAVASGVHTSTIGAMMYGDRKTKAETVDKVAGALASRIRDKDPGAVHQLVHQLVGRALGAVEPFRPHPDADLLTAQERKAVNEMIRLLAASRQAAGEAPQSTDSPKVDLAFAAPRAFLVWAVDRLDASGRPVDSLTRKLRDRIAHGDMTQEIGVTVLSRLEQQLAALLPEQLSAPSGEVLVAVAAHEEEGSIAGEQEESDTP